MADRNRYNRRGRYQDWGDRDERAWRQQEQYSTSDYGQPDYEEGYGSQTGDSYAGGRQGQRQGEYESGWDRDNRYRQGGSGYARGLAENAGYGGYRSTGEYNYGPARFTGAPGWRGSSFTMNDQAGRDFNSRTDQNFGAYGDYGAPGFPGYGGFGGFNSYGGYGAAETEERPSGRDSGSARGYDRNRRDWWDRTSDEVMSWFGDDDAARRRRMDHSGRGPQNYTRSDDRIREDVNDNLTDDWAVDASNITVRVDGGEVTLDGTVSTRLQKRRAEDCAEDVSGVKHVQNNLRVQEKAWDQSGGTTSASGTTASSTSSTGGTTAKS